MADATTIGTAGRSLRVAIIGSGPAGFYASDALLRSDLMVEVDLFDRLPTPYGLVRGGVAPDHQQIKKVTRVYDNTASLDGFRFLGNVRLGGPLSVEQLRRHYDQIVYAVGNEADRRLGIPGEGMTRCTPASVFVGWYNGHPDYRRARLDLSVNRVAVVGNGNVAIDVARILARAPDELAATDIASHAAEALAESAVREIFVIGRRGPVQAAFTPSELKELDALERFELVVDPVDLELDPLSRAALESAPKRARRNVQLLEEFAACGEGHREGKIRFLFLSSPVEVVAGEEDTVAGLVIERNRIVERDDGSLRPQATGERYRLDVGMVIPAIGFAGERLAGVPFREDRTSRTRRAGG